MELDAYGVTEPTYAEVGATRDGRLPTGYRHLRHRALIGHSQAAFASAADALLGWRMHAAVGLRVTASAPEAAPGVTVVSHLGLGRLAIAAPCRVVWVERTENRAGFAYGTLPGHPERGEESFVIERSDNDEVWLTITAFSAAARWYVRAVGPVPPFFQRLFARRCASVLTRLAADR